MQTQAQIKRATLDAHRAIEQLDANGAAELIEIYEQAAEDIASRLFAAAGGDDNIALQELRSLLDQVNRILKELSAQRDQLVAGALETATDWGVRPFFTASAQLAPAAMKTSTEALKFVRDFIAEDGLQLSDRVWRIDRGARDKVINAIESAVIQGHGAGQAAREFLARGEAVPADVANKLTMANSRQLAKTTGELMTGNGSPLSNALRLFRTEINRAHGEAYMKGGESHPDFGGWKYLLSPAHPEPDICDLLSTQNLHGLGRGVYPTRAKTPWPAHPNTLSFIEIVFKNEIGAGARSGKETPVEALARLKPEQREGVLGKNKNAIYDEGLLRQGMIRAPWRAVKARIEGRPGEHLAYEWDAGKRISNVEKHGLDFVDAAKVFSGPTHTWRTRGEKGTEPRWVTLGMLEGIVAMIVHTRRPEGTRIISFRKATRREQATYHRHFSPEQD